ncbi:hypothetical protein B0H11DRAFT_1911520 [Mycena galericulata]|nr:hypothetical protein B0H11DRAFT_1911520 [Mycena galericulata]
MSKNASWVAGLNRRSPGVWSKAKASAAASAVAIHAHGVSPDVLYFSRGRGFSTVTSPQQDSGPRQSASAASTGRSGPLNLGSWLNQSRENIKPQTRYRLPSLDDLEEMGRQMQLEITLKEAGLEAAFAHARQMAGFGISDDGRSPAFLAHNHIPSMPLRYRD